MKERKPAKISGFREDVVRARAIAKHMVKALSYSVWVRRRVMVISAFEFAEAPDGSGDSIFQWNVSVSHGVGRPSEQETRQALACFGMSAAEEDNHHIGGSARHFWLPVDPARRVDCECKATERVHVEPDGYRATTAVDGPCSGCELAAMALAETGIVKPCPLHPEPST